MMSLEADCVQVTLKSDFKEVFKSGPTNSWHENITISLAIAAFVEKRVTLLRAAELAGKSVIEFIDLLSKYNIPWMEYTEETFNEDQETLSMFRDHTDDLSERAIE